MNIVPNLQAKDSPATFYLDWGNGDRDTIICAITKRDGAYQFTTEVWYNGTKVFDRSSGSGDVITIIK